MKRIYFDYNLFCFLQNPEEYKELFDNYNKLKEHCIFPYSAAHMEEVATIFRQDKNKVPQDEILRRVEKIVETISFISQNKALRLDRSNQILLETEEPIHSLTRVAKLYELTVYAEEIDKLFSYQKNKNTQEQVHIREEKTFEELRSQYGIEPRRIGNLSPLDIFKNKDVIRFFANHIIDFNLVDLDGDTWEKIKHDKNKIQTIIERLMKGLYMVGYKADKYAKYRSGMHDISHAFYATSCDYFVTQDIETNYFDRVSAVYGLLKVPTKVITLAEFNLLNQKI